MTLVLRVTKSKFIDPFWFIQNFVLLRLLAAGVANAENQPISDRVFKFIVQFIMFRDLKKKFIRLFFYLLNLQFIHKFFLHFYEWGGAVV